MAINKKVQTLVIEHLIYGRISIADLVARDIKEHNCAEYLAAVRRVARDKAMALLQKREVYANVG
jgi:hypothetical protein